MKFSVQQHREYKLNTHTVCVTHIDYDNLDKRSRISVLTKKLDLRVFMFDTRGKDEENICISVRQRVKTTLKIKFIFERKLDLIKINLIQIMFHKGD